MPDSSFTRFFTPDNYKKIIVYEKLLSRQSGMGKFVMKIKLVIVAAAVVILTTACGGGGDSHSGGDSGGAGNQSGTSQVLSLNTIGNRTVTANENLNFTLSASNPNGGTLSYSVSVVAGIADPFNLPDTNDATFNQLGNAIFNWTPVTTNIGSYELKFTVENTNGESDSETILLVAEGITGQFQNGESNYNGQCQSCHGPRGSNGSKSPIHCVDSGTFFSFVNSGGDMAGFASGWNDSVKDNVLFYLNNVNPAVCYL